MSRSADMTSCAPGAAQPTTISDIPPEVFETIAQVADPKILVNMRLVNREIDCKVFGIFGKRMFATKACMVCSEASLRRLLAILEDLRLGPYVKKLVLCLEAVPYLGPKLQAQCDPEMLEDYHGAWSRQRKFEDSGKDRKLLAMVLSCLRKLGSPLEITPQEAREQSSPPFGYLAIRDASHSDLRLPHYDIVRLFELAVDAIGNSDVHVKCLSVSSREPFYLNTFFRKQGPLFVHVRNLFQSGCCHIESMVFDNLDVRDSQLNAGSAIMMFSYLQTLKTLSLGFGTFQPDL
jgi:hypothetical protein